MTVPPKLRIVKKIVLDSAGHYRFYSPFYPNRKPFMVSLNPETEYNSYGEAYPFLNVQTEKQLALFLFQQFGDGFYRIYAFIKGRKGLYTFWDGEVNSEGWTFFSREYDKKDIVDIEKEMEEAETVDERNELENLKEIFKDDAKKDLRQKKYGIAPFLKSSGRRGSWHTWDEIESEEDDENYSDDIKKLNENKNPSIDDMNNF